MPRRGHQEIPRLGPSGLARADWGGDVSAQLVRARFSTLLALLGAILIVGPAAAQDGDLDGLMLLPFGVSEVKDASSQSFQIYRIPISYPIRRLEDNPWGLRLTLPVSLGTYELQAATGIGDVVESIQSVVVIPGVEFLLPAGERWVLKPFAEVGVGGDSRTGETHLLYAAGVRARGTYEARPFELMVGSAFRYRSPADTDVVENWYSTVEAGLDAQLPLGFSVGSRGARGGGYAILRHFSNLEFELVTEGPFDVSWNYEVGISFATEPVLQVWKIKLPWIGLGYRFGDRTRGTRLSFAFPF
jgi:hypothetical protein